MKDTNIAKRIKAVAQSVTLDANSSVESQFSSRHIQQVNSSLKDFLHYFGYAGSLEVYREDPDLAPRVNKFRDHNAQALSSHRQQNNYECGSSQSFTLVPKEDEQLAQQPAYVTAVGELGFEIMPETSAREDLIHFCR